MPISIVGDLGNGTCYEHDSPTEFITTYISGADSVYINNQPATIIGTIGDADCGHSTIAVSGSGTVFIENMAVHRLGDVGAILDGAGEYVSLIGSDDVFAGD